MTWIAVCLGGLLWLPTANGSFNKVVDDQGQHVPCTSDQEVQVKFMFLDGTEQEPTR